MRAGYPDTGRPEVSNAPILVVAVDRAAQLLLSGWSLAS